MSKRGTIYGLLGPAGSGKSTVVRLLLGLLEPTAGSVHVLGLDPARDGAAVHAQCGVVLQSPSLYSRLSVQQNLDLLAGFGASSHRSERREALNSSSVRFVGAAQRALWPSQPGYAAAAGVDRGDAAPTGAAVLDQPTAELDPSLADALRASGPILAAEEHVTIFLTTETLADAKQIASAWA